MDIYFSIGLSFGKDFRIYFCLTDENNFDVRQSLMPGIPRPAWRTFLYFPATRWEGKVFSMFSVLSLEKMEYDTYF